MEVLGSGVYIALHFMEVAYMYNRVCGKCVGYPYINLIYVRKEMFSLRIKGTFNMSITIFQIKDLL